jgi:hypothetical protein
MEWLSRFQMYLLHTNFIQSDIKPFDVQPVLLPRNAEMISES